MKRLCAWCGKNMGEKEPLDDKRATHGLCDKCAKKLENKETKTMKELKQGDSAKIVKMSEHSTLAEGTVVTIDNVYTDDDGSTIYEASCFGTTHFYNPDCLEKIGDDDDEKY